MVMEIILYAVIALLIALRLYSLLGERHGDERTRDNPFATPPRGPSTKDAGKEGDRDEDVLAFPLSPSRNEAAPLNPLAIDPGPAPESLAGNLHAIAAADPSFDDKSFLKGARMAFEMIVQAFAAAERGALKNLVSERLYNAFEKAITARESAGEKLEMRMLSLRDADITAARLEGGHIAFITVQFVSDQRKITIRADGSREDGGLAQLTDSWTFRRDTQSRDPNWVLVETRAH